jgi:2-polyprenyl-6-methoxyphenol hydroxylase-like FAD-dependent oxidoreductase
MTGLPIVIAGGGIAGLSAAIGLAGRSLPVRLFEQAAAFEEVGAGLQMSPNGVRALRALGAWEEIAPACVIPSEIHVKDGRSGGLLQRIRLGKPFEAQFGAPYRVCHRADLLAGLLAVARSMPALELNTSARLTHVEDGPGGVVIALQSGGEVRGRALVGADGIRSTVRRGVLGPVEPRGCGHVIYRDLVPLNVVPPDIDVDCVTLWLCPGAHVVHYAVSNWRNFNIVAVVEASAPEAGWSSPVPDAEVARHFADACDPLRDLLAAARHWLRWPGADLPELPRWTSGNTVLVGDAAHATLPYLAQGAVMALEDAAVLAREIARNASDRDAFRSFERQRKPRTSLIQMQSRRQGRIYHARGVAALARNALLRLAGSDLALKRARWIYDWKPPE